MGSLTSSNTLSSQTFTSSQSIINSITPSSQTLSSITTSNSITVGSHINQCVSHIHQGLTMSLTSTSSESEQDFLETCHATTLLDLEDEELPDQEDENEDVENEDDDDYEDLMEDDCYEMRISKRRSWDDEYVLKRQFSALIPAFDPRPGRTNINQTTDLEIPHPSVVHSNTEENKETPHAPKVMLTLKGPNITGCGEFEIDLVNSSWTIFSAIQRLIQSCDLGTRQEKIRRIWEPTYVIVYREAKEGETFDDKKPIQSASVRMISKSLGVEEEVINMSNEKVSYSTVDDVLQLLRLLYLIVRETKEEASLSNLIELSDTSFNALYEDFISKKITNKLLQQIQDPLTLASGSQPDWCDHLTYSYPMLFPFETRQLYFSCTAFGTSRSIVWLQNQRDTTLERVRGPSPRREDPHEFRVGRLRHERVKVPRGDNLLSWAVQVMKTHVST